MQVVTMNCNKILTENCKIYPFNTSVNMILRRKKKIFRIFALVKFSWHYKDIRNSILISLNQLQHISAIFRQNICMYMYTYMYFCLFFS